VISLTLWYSHDQTDGDIARTHQELDAALDRLTALSRLDWPALAEVTKTDDLMGPLLYVGARADRGALVYSGDDDPDGSCTSNGLPQDGEPLLYMYMTSDMTLPPDAEVDVEQVRQAVHEFADTGTRPATVLWQPWRSGPAQGTSG
jgi:hypothetical protein